MTLETLLRFIQLEKDDSEWTVDQAKEYIDLKNKILAALRSQEKLDKFEVLQYTPNEIESMLNKLTYLKFWLRQYIEDCVTGKREFTTTGIESILKEIEN